MLNGLRRITISGLLLLMLWVLPSCAAVGSERLFLTVNLDYLDRYELAPTRIQDTEIGGLSALSYDPHSQRLYALSDDRTHPHLYTFELTLKTEGETPQFSAIVPQSVTFLKTADGDLWRSGTLDPEGMALTPEGTFWISSEGVYATDTPPQILEFEAASGQFRRSLPIPQPFIVAMDPETRRQVRGVQSNLGIEGLTLSRTGSSPSTQEPLRLFAINESPLIQDLDPSVAEEGGRLRLLHYYGAEGPPLLLTEHLYSLETVPLALVNGVSEILALDNAGHFLSLERALTPFGWQVKLFQIAIAGASDIANRSALQGKLDNVKRIEKQLILDFNTLKFPVQNFEGMTWGPLLPDGSRSLIIVSDNNFDTAETTEFLLLRLKLL